MFVFQKEGKRTTGVVACKSIYTGLGSIFSAAARVSEGVAAKVSGSASALRTEAARCMHLVHVRNIVCERTDNDERN